MGAVRGLLLPISFLVFIHRKLAAHACRCLAGSGTRWRLYGQLQDYVAEHGQLPPLNTSGALGIWVTTQRQARKNGMLSEERQRLLEAISCWSWDPLEAQWRQMYEQLLHFVAVHRRQPAPKDGDGLWQWCRDQRAAYQDLQSGRAAKHGGRHATPQRIGLMEAVPGWKWWLLWKNLYTCLSHFECLSVRDYVSKRCHRLARGGQNRCQLELTHPLPLRPHSLAIVLTYVMFALFITIELD